MTKILIEFLNAHLYQGLNYKHATLEKDIPEDAGELHEVESDLTFCLYKTAPLFQDMRSPSPRKETQRRITLPSLVDLPGEVSPRHVSKNTIKNHLRAARVIVADDGRIYVEQRLLEHEAYLRTLKATLKEARKRFLGSRRTKKVRPDGN